jgi:hypothetical protein
MFGFSNRRPPNRKGIIHNKAVEDSCNLQEGASPSSRAGVEGICRRAVVVDRGSNKPGVVGSLSRVSRVQGFLMVSSSSSHKEDRRDNHRWGEEEAVNLVVGEENQVVGEENQVVGEEEDGEEEEEEEVGEGLIPMHLLQAQLGLHFPICPKLFSRFLLPLLLTNSSRLWQESRLEPACKSEHSFLNF